MTNNTALTPFGVYISDNSTVPIMAKRLGITTAYVYMLMKGKISPSLALAAEIEKFTNGRVSLQSWIPYLNGFKHGS